MSALRSMLQHQMHRQATLQPRMAIPAGRTVSLEEGYRLAKLYQEEEARVDEEELSHSKTVNGTVALEESVSKKIVLLRQKQNKEANLQAAVAYAHRQKKQNRVIQPADTEKVLEIAQKIHRKHNKSDEAHQRRQRAMEAKKSKEGKRK